MDVGNVAGFPGRGGEADLGGRREIFQNLPPGRILGGAAAMALIDHDEVEEFGRELTKNLLVFFRFGDRLIEAEIDFVDGVDAPSCVDGAGQVFGSAVRAFRWSLLLSRASPLPRRKAGS